MLKSARIKAKRDELRASMDAYLAAKEATDGYNPAEDAEYQALKAKDGGLKAQYEEAIASESYERTAPAASSQPGNGDTPPVVRGTKLRAEDDPARGFRSHREFLTSVLENTDAKTRADVSDERLRPLAVFDKDDKKAAGELAYVLPSAYTPRSLKAAAGTDEQNTYDDRYGGFGVQRTRLPGMLEVGWEGDPTAGLTQGVPMQTPTVEIMARTDKNHTSSVSGGFTVARKAEAAAAAASRGQLEMVTMKAASLFGFGYATNELMADSPATFVALVDTGFRTQFPAALLNEKIRGLGGDQFDGVVNTAACTVSQAKETGQAAATIVYNNVIKMASRCWGFGQAIWLANHDTRPQLSVLAVPIGTGGALIYQPAPSVGMPDMLLGRPLFYTEFAATVGTVGDLILGNWSQYLEGLYQPLQSDESVHLRFDRHETAFKFWLRNAGAPWWRSALTPNQSTTTLSPFVTLATRS
jgi:HK97 family phage major capsid protein